jgi:hypothetical protein
VIKEGGGLHTYAIEAHPDYAEVMLVRATLHLSAKSLLGIETSRMDWSRAYETVREIRRGLSLGDNDGDEEEEEEGEEEDDDDDGGGGNDDEEARRQHRKRRPQKVKGRRAGGAASRFISLLLLQDQDRCKDKDKAEHVKGGRAPDSA